MSMQMARQQRNKYPLWPYALAVGGLHLLGVTSLLIAARQHPVLCWTSLRTVLSIAAM